MRGSARCRLERGRLSCSAGRRPPSAARCPSDGCRYGFSGFVKADAEGYTNRPEYRDRDLMIATKVCPSLVRRPSLVKPNAIVSATMYFRRELNLAQGLTMTIKKSTAALPRIARPSSSRRVLGRAIRSRYCRLLRTLEQQDKSNDVGRGICDRCDLEGC